MHPSTGQIMQFETDMEAKIAGFTVPLTNDEAKDLKILPRKERLAFVDMTKNQRKAWRKKLKRAKR